MQSRCIKGLDSKLPLTVTASRRIIRPVGAIETTFPTLPLTAFKETIFFSFLIKRLFAHSYRNAEVQEWVHEGCRQIGPWSLPHTSVKCLAAAYFGRMHKQPAILAYGAQLYGEALRLLNQNLEDAEQAYSLQILTSTMILQVYEFIGFTSNNGWIQHAGGIGRLIEVTSQLNSIALIANRFKMRGPWRHQTEPEKTILTRNRNPIVRVRLLKRHHY